MDLPDIVCVQIVYPNGQVVYESLADYRRNPTAGTYILTDQRIRSYDLTT